MKYKIENIILNITNYPFVARHLEDRAEEGWILDRVILASIFIFKSGEKEDLDFNIIPYPDEGFFKKKSKKDINIYIETNEDLGWNYLAKSGAFQIYYKEKTKEAQDIIGLKSTEFYLLEEIGKFQNLGNYLIILLFLFYSFRSYKDTMEGVFFIKSAAGQLLLVILLFGLTRAISDNLSIYKFLKKNRENMEEGRPIEYKDSKYTFQKISNIGLGIIMFFFIAYILYIGLYLGESLILASLIPLSLALMVGTALRFIVKPRKSLEGYKGIIYIAAIILVITVSTILIYPRMDQMDMDAWKKDLNVDEDKYKVLQVSDFSEEDRGTSVKLTGDISFLAPRSYIYREKEDAYSYSNRDNSYYINTDYTRTISTAIAKDLVRRHKKGAEAWLKFGEYSLGRAYDLNRLREDEIEKGLTQEDFQILRKEPRHIFIKKAQEIIVDRAMEDANGKLWNVDQAYYLDYNKDQIVLRKGKEVYMLSGLDFSDSEIRKIVMEKLGFE